jgi:signal transduction histidine kinase
MIRRGRTLGRRGLRVGLGLLALALVAGIVVQYEWLRETADAAPAVYQAAADAGLRAVAAGVEDDYRAEATRALGGPADAIDRAHEDDDAGRYFRNAPPDAATYYYLFSILEGRGLKVTLAHPTRQIDDDPNRRWYWGVARNASLRWIDAISDHAVGDGDRLGVFEANPSMLVVYKPVVDDSSRVVGVAGMIVDPAYLRDVRLPRALASAVAAAGSNPALASLDVSGYDAEGALVFGPGGPDDAAAAAAPLEFPFPDWRLVARPRGASFAETARRRFAVGLAEMGLVAALLVAGCGTLVRASAREMRVLKSKADFVATMTHEFQSPLTSIRLHAELLRTGRIDGRPQIEECGSFIEREAARLGELANNILDFAKMDAGRKTYRFRELDLVTEVEAAVGRAAVSLDRANLSVDIETPPAARALVVADPEAIGRAVSNVLDNAIKWSKAGDRIEIRFGEDGGLAWVSIADFGRGVPRADLGRIFEQFYRVDTGLEHDAKGSGIGLAIVKSIVDAHRGRVTVASRPGAGSTFTLAFPTSAPAPDPRRADEAAVEAGDR